MRRKLVNILILSKGKILDEIIKDVYIHFKFDQDSFQFELKHAN